ncbi:MAG: porin [Hyphomicrobiaceae bacterium]
MKTTSRFAIAAAASVLMGGFAVTPTKAADLGGDCCADLEERVAELEATTVRKGNRKVSVTLYGWVNQAVLWWDNGEESDIYVTDVSYGESRFGVKGSGTLRQGTEIGYRLELGTSKDGTIGLDANDQDDFERIRIRQAYWYWKDDRMGTLTVGQQYPASSGTGAVEVGGAGGWVSYNQGASDAYGGFTIYDATAGAYTSLSWFAAIPNFDPGRLNLVKYTSPEFAGFTASASWGEDDRWDVGLTYSKDWNGVYVAAGVGYFVDDDNGDGNVYSGGKEEVFSASAGVYHAASGVYGELGYMKRNPELVDLDTTSIYAKVGLRKNWHGLGETDIYVEYQKVTDAIADDTSGTMWGVGIGQDLDAVGATAYLSYRHNEADLDAIGIDAADFDTVIAGMVVPF